MKEMLKTKSMWLVVILVIGTAFIYAEQEKIAVGSDDSSCNLNQKITQ